MLRFFYRSLLFDRQRALLSVAAVAAAIVLVVVLEGFKEGLWQQVRAYREHLSVQLVATPAGASGSVFTRSALPARAADQVSQVPGVKRVYPLVNVPAIFAQDEKKTSISVIGYEGAGGPWQLKAGRAIVGQGELVMDYALARKYRFAVGDWTTLLGREFQIVGLSTGTSSMLGSYVFIGLEDALSLLSGAQLTQGAAARGTPNLLLVEIVPGTPVPRVQQAISEAVPAVNVLTPQDLAANDVGMVQELMGSVLNLLVSVAYLVGVLVIGLTLCSSILERLREYGIMKALGVPNYQLYRYVLGQALAFALGGFALGFIASFGVVAVLSWLVPQYQVLIWDTQVLLRAGVAALAMASVAALLPIRQVAGVDPALVFRQ